MPYPRDFTPGDDHGYIEGVPYAEVIAQWDPEDIDSPERYFPYTRGSGADRARQSGFLTETGREERAAIPSPPAPAPIPGPHLTPDSTTDPEGD